MQDDSFIRSRETCGCGCQRLAQGTVATAKWREELGGGTTTVTLKWFVSTKQVLTKNKQQSERLN